MANETPQKPRVQSPEIAGPDGPDISVPLTEFELRLMMSCVQDRIVGLDKMSPTPESQFVRTQGLYDKLFDFLTTLKVGRTPDSDLEEDR